MHLVNRHTIFFMPSEQHFELRDKLRMHRFFQLVVRGKPTTS